MSTLLQLGALLVLLAPAISFPHSKTDEIMLANGNVLTGEIKGLLQGRLSYGTDSLGTVRVEWEDVLQVSSGFRYEIRLQDGTRYYGSLANGGGHGKLRVADLAGEHEIAILDVVELRPLEESVADRFDIRLGAGYAYTKSGNVSTFSLTSELNYQDQRGVTGLDGRSSRTSQETGSTSSNRYSVSRQLWTRRQRVVRWFDGSYEDNDELELDYRYTAGLGLGRSFVDTNRHSLIGYLGIQGAIERSLRSEKFESLEGVLGATYALWQLDSPELDLKTEITAYPGLSESGRLRGNANIRLSWELFDDLFWDITAWMSYDNRSQSGSKTDYGLTTGIGWDL